MEDCGEFSGRAPFSSSIFHPRPAILNPAAQTSRLVPSLQETIGQSTARDLRKISPFGRNDHALFLGALCAFARDTLFRLILHPKIPNILARFKHPSIVYLVIE